MLINNNIHNNLTDKQNIYFSGKPKIFVSHIKKLLEEGKTVKEISEEYNISKTYIYSILKNFNLESIKAKTEHNNKLKRQTESDEIKRLIEEGKSITKISEILNYSSSKIYHILKDFNIEVRPRSISTQKVQEILKSQRDYPKTGSISEQTGLSKATIRRIYKQTTSLTPSEIKTNHIINMANLGYTKSEIAEKMNMTISGIRAILYRHKISIRSKSEIHKNLIIEKFKLGMTQKEIATELKLSKLTIYRYLKSCGLIKSKK